MDARLWAIGKLHIIIQEDLLRCHNFIIDLLYTFIIYYAIKVTIKELVYVIQILNCIVIVKYNLTKIK